MSPSRTLALFLLPLAVACGDVNEDCHDHDHEGEHDHGDCDPSEQEVITTVELVFTPTGGGDPLTVTWADPEDDGDPIIDAITLADGAEYGLSVSFLNELEDPAEDITPEVEDEAEEHQVLFTGSAVQGPATGDNQSAVVEHAYADADSDGLPIGLANTLTTLGTGSGDLVVTLRHLPPEDGSPVKVEGLAETVASDGFGAIGGGNDAQVTFPLTVE